MVNVKVQEPRTRDSHLQPSCELSFKVPDFCILSFDKLHGIASLVDL